MKSVALGLLMVFCIACKNNTPPSLEISGTLNNFSHYLTQHPELSEQKLYILSLYEIPFGGNAQPVQIASDTLTQGEVNFTLKGLTRSSGLFDIVLENTNLIIPLINDHNPLKVDIDLAGVEPDYSVSGSVASQDLKKFILAYNSQSLLYSRSMDSLNRLKQLNAPDSTVLSVTQLKNEQLNQLNKFLTDFLEHTQNGTVATFALGRAAQTFPQDVFEKSLTTLTEKFPEDESLEALQKQFQDYKQQAAAQKAPQQKSWVGKPAPELVLPDTAGRSVALSSLKGKFVLVDFWASWCRPCRMENPTVRAAYLKFRNKNFTVLGVSLDKNKEPWLEAIQEDGLSWTHISDLAFWNSVAVQTFGFEGIPYNILIDPQGMVIAEGLRGEALIQQLQKSLP